MGVLRSKLFLALQEVGVEFRETPTDFRIRHKGRTVYIPRIDPDGEYKIKEVRHLVRQADLPREVMEKHIPEL